MKRILFVTMLLLSYFLAISQSSYDAAKTVKQSTIKGFKIFDTCEGKLNNYGEIFKTHQIVRLFDGAPDFVDFKVYYKAPNSEILKYVAHGAVRTNFRFSTPLKEPGVYFCIFKPKSGDQKMIVVDARTKDLKLQLAEKQKNTKL